jgi:uncharacterized protein YfiM (DUF2279 family)
MKKLGIIAFICALIVGAVFANVFSFGKFSVNIFSFSRGITGSGNLQTEKREVSEFKAINVGGVFKVEITAQKDFDVQIEADDNLLQYIKTETDGETLEISTEKRISTRNPIIVKIGAPDIENLEVSGASSVSLGNLNNDSLKVNLSGASNVKTEGFTKNLKIELSGASRINAENLQSENVSVDASGASKADVFASTKLEADLSGASKVTYSGSPKDLFKKTSGASCIKEK